MNWLFRLISALEDHIAIEVLLDNGTNILILLFQPDMAFPCEDYAETAKTTIPTLKKLHRDAAVEDLLP